MRLDYIVSRIETSQDNNSYAYVTFSNPYHGPTCPFGPNKMVFTSPEDLMKNLPKAMANIGGGGILTDSPTFKIILPLSRSFSHFQDQHEGIRGHWN